MKVLVIEDTDLIREEIETILEMEGYNVIGAPNGEVGIRSALEDEPDIILCDIMMPGMDGYEVLQRLKSFSPDFSIPFIFLTSRTSRQDLRKGMLEGADDYITKPFTSEELVHSIRSRLERHKILREPLQREVEKLRESISFTLPKELLISLNGMISTANILSQAGDEMDMESVRNMARNLRSTGIYVKNIMFNFLLHAQVDMWSRDDTIIKQLRSQHTRVDEEFLTKSVQPVAAEFNREADLIVQAPQDSIIPMAEEHLKRYLMELIKNAFQFSMVGSPVRVTMNAEEKKYQISVIDQGVGMTDDEIRSIGSFIQFNKSDALSSQNGVGLGLSIARKLIEIHGGEFLIKSVPGKFTEVAATWISSAPDMN